ncbi:exported hypothetical protein [Gammaproteobacteria bacterium]
MRKFLATIFMLITSVSQSAQTTQTAESSLWREAGQACVFGGSVLGVTSIVVLYPAIAMGSTSLPVTSLILGNTLFGCGISAIGASAAYGFGWAYDRAFGLEEVVPSKAPKTGGASPAPAVPPALAPPIVTPPTVTPPAPPAAGPTHSSSTGKSSDPANHGGASDRFYWSQKNQI